MSLRRCSSGTLLRDPYAYSHAVTTRFTKEVVPPYVNVADLVCIVQLEIEASEDRGECKVELGICKTTHR